jgi:hypothetical protein
MFELYEPLPSIPLASFGFIHGGLYLLKKVEHRRGLSERLRMQEGTTQRECPLLPVP